MTYINPTNFKSKESLQVASNGTNILLVPATGLGTNFRVYLPSITGQLAVVSQLGGGGGPITSVDVTDFAEAVDDRVATLLVQSTGINISYNDGANTITLKSTGLITDHGLLSGLSDDDHTQYHNDARGDARYPQLAGSYSEPSWISAIKWTNITTTPTTLAGYGITDAVINTRSVIAGTGLIGGGTLGSDIAVNVVFGTTATTSCAGNDSRHSDSRTPSAHTHTSSEITDFAESVDDRINALFVAGTGMAIVYNDVANTFTISATGTSAPEGPGSGPTYSQILSYINIG